MNHNNQPTIPFNEFRDIDSNAGLITKITLFMVLVTIFLIPWGDGFWDGTVRVGATLALGFSVIFFVSQGTYKNYSAFHVIIIIYIAWQIISLAWTSDLEWGIPMAIRSGQLILFAFMFSLVINNKKKINLAYQAYVVGNLVGSGIIVSNYLNGIQSPYYNRYGIVNIETDMLSVILALAIPMAAYVASKSNTKIVKLINIAAIPIIFYAIFLTGTRTGAIVAVLGLMYWMFTYRKSSIVVKATIFFLLIVSFIAILSLAPKASIDRVFSAGESISSGTLNHRTVIWKGAIEQWKNKPIIGSGLGGLGHGFSKENLVFRDAHNSFLHLLAETGIVGVLLYLMIFVSLFYYTIHTPFEEKIFLLTLMACIFISQQSTHTHINKFIWFSFSMIAIHALKYSSKEDNS